MMDKDQVVRNQWIIIGLIFLVLALNVVFVFIGRIFPAGEFKGSTLNMSDCTISSLKVTGVGETRDEALATILIKQDNYAHLYCNGKFRDDPDDVSIVGIGCPTCKPKCTVQVTELTETKFNENRYGVEASKDISVNCV